MLDTIIGNKRNILAADSLLATLGPRQLVGSLYIGYPILPALDDRVAIDALLVCQEHGIVVFDFPDLSETPPTKDALEQRLDALYLAVELLLKRVRELVVQRALKVNISTLSYLASGANSSGANLPIVTSDTLPAYLATLPPITSDDLRLVNAALERVSTIRATHKRPQAQRSDSRGGLIARIDKEIANLDRWQKDAAIAIPDGPQRIRGLAGSGKTIVLALKAAYLHASHPEWNIALTFQTRALHQQLKALVRRFFFEHCSDEPDWDRLQIMNAWGSARQPGVYSQLAEQFNQIPRDFLYARATYGSDKAFQGLCDELLASIKETSLEPLYDALLIDEAQDFPSSFFELAYHGTKDPKRITWAYDELQNLGRYSMAPPAELFGIDSQGRPHISDLRNQLGQAKQDLVLPVCYRNTPWSLTTAHAAGFGIYRTPRLVQFFSDSELWEAVGYNVIAGELRPGSYVSLERRQDASPEYFRKLLTSEDAVSWEVFESRQAQIQRTADLIAQNLSQDELLPSDILVILANPITARTDSATLMEALGERAIAAHLAGVTSSRDELFVEGSVAVSGIHRAKGNEAPMVYLLDADYCFDGLDLIRRRNILFTAITRSRAWVRIFGCGDAMRMLAAELNRVRENCFRLNFDIPSRDELERLRQIHRDRSPGEVEKVRRLEAGVSELIETLERGEIARENLNPDLLAKIELLLGSRS